MRERLMKACVIICFLVTGGIFKVWLSAAEEEKAEERIEEGLSDINLKKLYADVEHKIPRAMDVLFEIEWNKRTGREELNKELLDVYL